MTAGGAGGTAVPTSTAWKMLGVVCLAQFLGMTLWFSATAVTPLLIDEFQISPSHAAWLTMAVQAGFVVGTLVSAVSNIADVVNARVLMFIGSLAGACANAAVLVAPNGTAVIALRFVTGASLALVYPPAMKIAAGWFRDPTVSLETYRDCAKTASACQRAGAFEHRSTGAVSNH